VGHQTLNDSLLSNHLLSENLLKDYRKIKRQTSTLVKNMSSLLGTQVKRLHSRLDKVQRDNEERAHSSSSDDEEVVLDDLILDGKVCLNMHRTMNKTQGKWFTNEFKAVGYQGQVIDQQVNKYRRNVRMSN
jgi:hypothetical protein